MNITFLVYLFSIFSSSFSIGYHRDLYTFYLYSFQSFVSKLCLFFLFHYNIRCLFLIDIICADFPKNKMRFFLTYNFYSVIYNIRILLSCFISDNQSLFSITNIFPVANWMEREIFDMFGLIFYSHPDLRRILTDYGFFGNPLKKDYPLSGFIEVHYDEKYKCVMSNKINFIQDFRNYSYDLPWSFNY